MSAQATMEIEELVWPGRTCFSEEYSEPTTMGLPEETGKKMLVDDESDAESVESLKFSTTSGHSEVDPRSSSVSLPPRPALKTCELKGAHVGRYVLLKKYEGYVTEITNQSFHARLTESLGEHPVVDAEFDIEEISAQDRKRLIEGALLVWTIGYRYQGSTVSRESLIYLRNLPQWTDEELACISKRADNSTRAIKWD